MRKPLKARALSVFLWCRQHAAKSHVSRRKGERLDEERSRNQAVRASMGGGLGRGGREKDGQVSSDSVVRGLAGPLRLPASSLVCRSEERRVGKECRSR